MRNSYLKAFFEIAAQDSNTIACIADSATIIYDKFRIDYPKQFINFGISEANMITAAAGLAACGKKPYLYALIPFLTMQAYEHIRDDIALLKMNVKLIGISAGIISETLGSTHHAIEDIAIMRTLPEMTVISPATPREAYLATKAIKDYNSPIYMRLGTNKEAELFDDDYIFEVGKGSIIREGTQVAIVSTGSILGDVLKAATILEEKHKISCRVVNISTIKPFDLKLIRDCMDNIGIILTVEEHSVIGGLGSAALEALTKTGKLNGIVSIMGFEDTFCDKYGKHNEMKEAYGLSAEAIVARVKNLLYNNK